MKGATWLNIVAGMTTGMGNGSVFTLAFMLNLGRGGFQEWGGWGMDAYWPITYCGFSHTIMILFGIAFVILMGYTLKLHAVLEGQPE